MYAAIKQAVNLRYLPTPEKFQARENGGDGVLSQPARRHEADSGGNGTLWRITYAGRRSVARLRCGLEHKPLN